MNTPRYSFSCPPSFLSATFGLLLTAGLCVGAVHGQAQSLLNGSFELPALTGTIATGAGANWTVANGNPFVLTNGASSGTTPYGNQWELMPSGSTLTQTINGGFTVNTLYYLSLSCADDNFNAGDQLYMAVTSGTTTLANQSFAIPARTTGTTNGPLPFMTYSVGFTPTASGPVTITLTSVTTNGSIAIDNVGVPEPSTWALVLGGGCLLGEGIRRRKNHLV